ncbi:hypothetical protein QOZ80_6AG0550450 [Eleusine coracana subsp. coracana]|nr:hypothetical protein QOZ80_6AG0550450 [Eleusine coracana subsp. coracana]
MAISYKSVVMFMLLFSTIFSVQLTVPTHARKLEVRAPIIRVHPSYTGRSVLQAPAMQIDSTTPGHSPSIGHNSPPN